MILLKIGLVLGAALIILTLIEGRRYRIPRTEIWDCLPQQNPPTMPQPKTVAQSEQIFNRFSEKPASDEEENRLEVFASYLEKYEVKL